MFAPTSWMLHFEYLEWKKCPMDEQNICCQHICRMFVIFVESSQANSQDE